jgi:hypothetical protein
LHRFSQCHKKIIPTALNCDKILAIITFTTIKNKGKGKPSVYLKVNKTTKQNSTAQNHHHMVQVLQKQSL